MATDSPASYPTIDFTVISTVISVDSAISFMFSFTVYSTVTPKFFWIFYIYWFYWYSSRKDSWKLNESQRFSEYREGRLAEAKS